ncbi:hypothetical protein THAOC_07197 [Thalassiosira oceanica]|uniref:Gram-positive cocci surface proteins LPxTG domain-containing protein n=1 Tax=Thalassiosira oceanica TaxID=159749 RepID=K0SY63_THAOC|nr:hypothetical protein THAOC_07197 [Thalassiosira oceanica]|eukprot:EJK71373.1 hypothetical protein THAOC_07197 [Thalassiosira oceanica]
MPLTSISLLRLFFCALAACTSASAQAQLNTRRYRQNPSIKSNDVGRNVDSATVRSVKRNLRTSRQLEDMSMPVFIEAEFSSPFDVAEFSMPLESAEFSMPMSGPDSTPDEATSTVNLENGSSATFVAACALAGASVLVAVAAGGFIRVRRKRNADLDGDDYDEQMIDKDPYSPRSSARRANELTFGDLGDDFDSPEQYDVIMNTASRSSYGSNNELHE